MSQKPCLIFSNYLMRPNDGGPSGFLAQNVLGHASDYYQLGKCHGEPPVSRWQRFRQGYYFYSPAATLQKIGLQTGSHFGSWMLCARHTYVRENAAQYRYVWFHDVWSMAACLDLIPPQQKTILQCHCPELPSEETASQGIQAGDVKWSQQAERDTFARADVYVFANPGAQKIFSSLLKPGKQIEYLLSGSQALKTRHIVPLDPQYVYYLYIGRRNAIKGFDIILDAFKKAYASDNQLRLLLVGGGDCIQHPGVIDLGRSEEPGNWIAVCDYFINANRQSYFDLSVMEALSLGTPLIVACTGGHDYYANQSSPGVIPMPEASVELLTAAMLANRQKRSANTAATAGNLKIYQDQLSSAQYRARLEKLLQKVVAN